jgi:bile acid:Na+ symporter, BASS family
MIISMLKKAIYLSVVLLTGFVICSFLDCQSLAGPLLISAFTFLALYFLSHPFLKKFAFTIWVFTFVTASLYFPPAFGTWFGYDLKILIIPLIQIIMFGMGTTLSIIDFKRIITMPWPVFIGLALQFSIMPLLGFSLAMLFDFEAEIAAGVILVGSCPGGVASNLMAYLAGGNVALSVTMTSASTLVSPVMTPFLMENLAGKLVPIDFIAMMLSILNMIIVPIIAGIFANYILYSNKKSVNSSIGLALLAFISIVFSMIIFYTGSSTLGAIYNGLILGLLLIGVVALAKLVIKFWLKGPDNWMDKTLPVVSMAGICFIIAIITARSGEKLLTVGIALVAVSIIHNLLGYSLGYWLARLLRLKEKDCRTVAFEVGMQNGGMASGLAMGVLNSAKVALAPAIFGPWMNISGSVLATWWHRKPVE